MAKSEIENKIKNKILFAKEDIDSDQIWSSIEIDLPKKKRRKPIILVAFLCVFIFSIIGLVGLKYDSFDLNSIVKNNVGSSNMPEDKTKTNLKLNRLPNTEFDADSELNVKDDLITRNEFLIEKTQDNAKVISNIAVVKNYDKKEYTSSLDIETLEFALPIDSPNNFKTKNQNQKNNKSIEIDKEINSNENIFSSSLKNENFKTSSNIIITRPVDLPFKLNPLMFKRQLNISGKFVDVFKPDVKKRLKYSVELSSGYAFSKFNLTPNNSSEELIDFIKNLSLSSRVLESFKFNLSNNFLFRNGMFIKLGLNYSKINQEYVVSMTNFEIIERENELISITTDSEGVQSIENGTVGYLRETRIDDHYFSSYTIIQIPLRVGYQLQKNNLIFDVTIGSNIGLDFKQSGKQNIYNDGLILNPDIYKSRLNLDGNIEFGLGCGITNSINLWSRIGYSSSLSSVTKESYEISQNLSSIGMQLGIEIKI